MEQNSEIYLTNIREKINEMWSKRPEEVTKLRRRPGTLNNKGALLMAIEAESRFFVQDLFVLEQTAKSGKVDLESLKTITQALLNSKQGWQRSYKLQQTIDIMKNCVNAVGNVKNFAEYIEVLDSLRQYLNLWNYWLDLQIPWHDLMKTYERVLERE
jgi:hypothetical protein